MPPKLSIEKVKDIFKQESCILISESYYGIYDPLKYKCSCGSEAIHLITLENFKKGTRCTDCREKRRKTTNNTLYGVDYVTQNKDIKEKAITGIIISNEEKKHTIEELKEYYKNVDCELLETVYENNKTIMKFRCICGIIHSNRFIDFQVGKRCNNKNCVTDRIIKKKLENTLLKE